MKYCVVRWASLGKSQAPVLTRARNVTSSVRPCSIGRVFRKLRVRPTAGRVASGSDSKYSWDGATLGAHPSVSSVATGSGARSGGVS